ncbi:MAG: TonB-dependent receptor, partial [Lewinella sp.]|nr:TonB-dependent receptor [Lewinella sp.]
SKYRPLEAGYQLRSPRVNLRLMAYYINLRNQVSVRSFFLDSSFRDEEGNVTSGFVNYVINGQNSVSKGIEASAEVKLGGGFEARATGAFGNHRFTNRPIGKAFLDNNPNVTAERLLYVKNFVVAGTPQTAGTLGLTYNSPNFWFVNLNLNYFDDIYIDFFPQRRTLEAISNVPNPVFSQQTVSPESDLFDRIIAQEKAPSALTLDVFGGKSFKIKRQFIYINVGVNNILDKTDFITGGFEQSRFDFETRNVDRFPPRYFYAFGRNYFVSLDYSF